MKKITFLFVLGFLALSLNSFSQINVNSTGKVGINNSSPSYQLDVNGNLKVNSSYPMYYSSGNLYSTSSSSYLGTSSYFWGYLYARYIFYYYTPIQYSDKKLKKDILDLSDADNRLLELRPVKYKMIPRLSEGENITDQKNYDPEATHIGLIAQEVQKVYPELVSEDDEGTLGIKYNEFITILIKAYQDQQKTIDDLTDRIEKLESKE